ncbi:MAG TPA: GlsB/YeaQ/YmgE family stress response membrane protein [Pirellulales bacterium]|jgi:uncharacterized membrane protein YeaQ/YmgE (transglycosylase-associated protein family)|nr:GlsB/YeaQ/YmgE family stress response membrane protein [Pirellulales bacterium]
MITFAELAMAPGGWIAWIITGLIAGWLCGMVMRGGGYGFIGDTILGLIGALIGGIITGFFVTGVAGFWGSIVVAFIGACILVAISRAFTGRRSMVP